MYRLDCASDSKISMLGRICFVKWTLLRTVRVSSSTSEYTSPWPEVATNAERLREDTRDWLSFWRNGDEDEGEGSVSRVRFESGSDLSTSAVSVCCVEYITAHSVNTFKTSWLCSFRILCASLSRAGMMTLDGVRLFAVNMALSKLVLEIYCRQNKNAKICINFALASIMSVLLHIVWIYPARKRDKKARLAGSALYKNVAKLHHGYNGLPLESISRARIRNSIAKRMLKRVCSREISDPIVKLSSLNRSLTACVALGAYPELLSRLMSRNERVGVSG